MSYRLLRNIHLISGLIALPFLLMYAISAVQMAHNNWFPRRSTVQVDIPQQIETGLRNPADVAARLGLKGDIRGKLPTFRVVRPGRVVEVSYNSSDGGASTKTNPSTAIFALNRLHHAAGLWPAWMPLKLWGAAVGFVSFSLVLMSVTGLWMWWQRRQERGIGAVLLAANLGFALVVLALIRSAGP